MKRKYPLFLIDRSKLTAYPFDYVTCFDTEVGFVARVVIFNRDAPFNEFVDAQRNTQLGEQVSTYQRFKKGGGAILHVEEFIYDNDIDTNKQQQDRLKRLLKKGLKKFLHSDRERMGSEGDYSIDNQIEQQRLNLERAVATRDDLIKRAGGDARLADHVINLQKATIETLEAYRDNQKMFASWN